MICQKCKKQTPDDGKFCQNCGINVLEEKNDGFCRFCGKEINSKALKCKHCDKWIDGRKEYEGIGGWLLLPTISFFIIGILWLFCFIMYGIAIFSPEGNLNDFVTFLVSIPLTGLSIYSLVLEFKRKKLFPRLAIITLWVGAIATIILSLVDKDYSEVGGGVIGAALWTWYFCSSERVKNTFVK